MFFSFSCVPELFNIPFSSFSFVFKIFAEYNLKNFIALNLCYQTSRTLVTRYIGRVARHDISYKLAYGVIPFFDKRTVHTADYCVNLRISRFANIKMCSSVVCHKEPPFLSEYIYRIHLWEGNFNTGNRNVTKNFC